MAPLSPITLSVWLSFVPRLICISTDDSTTVAELKWADGSVESDLPMARLSELFNVNVHTRVFFYMYLSNVFPAALCCITSQSTRHPILVIEFDAQSPEAIVFGQRKALGHE